MERGYIKLWRKVMENPVLHERGKRYSRLEAWLSICLDARGTDDAKTGLLRGQFEASERYLAKRWNWSLSAVHRFLHALENNSMIKRVSMCIAEKELDMNHEMNRRANQFNICNYELYNETRITKRITKWNKSNKVLSKYNKETILPLTPKGGTGVDSVVELWNKTEGVRKIRNIDGKRQRTLKARLNDPTWQYAEAISKFPLRCFGDGKWIPEFDWFLRPGTVNSILEGKYDFTPSSPTPKQESIWDKIDREEKEKEAQANGK